MTDRAYSEERLKNLIHLVIWEAGSRANFGATKLYKVSWFSDARHFLLHGMSITGAPYTREKYGPIPKYGFGVRKKLEIEGAIKQWRGTGNEWVFKAVTPPDTNMFTSEELGIIRYWINHIDEEHTATSISDLSHDYGWDIAKTGEPLPIYAFLASRGREPNTSELSLMQAKARELKLI